MIDPVKKQPEEENKKEESIGHDTRTIVQRHLQNKDDVISDEDIRNVKVGDTEITPTVGAEAQARFDLDEEEKNDNDEINPSGRKPNPWDVLE